MFIRYRRRHPLVRGVLLFIIGVLAFAAIGLAVNAHRDSGQQLQAFPPTVLPVPPWDTTASAIPSPALSATSPSTSSPTTTSPSAPGPSLVNSSALTSPVHVTRGVRLVDGVYLGFPHSILGAVSAADEWATAILSTLDPNRSAAVMRLVADPSFLQGPQQAAQGTTGTRQVMGVPATGPVPVGASFEFVPVECQVRGIQPDAVTVLLLADFITSTPGTGTQDRVSVFPVALHWANQDWKVLPSPVTDYSGLDAQPDSPQAAALGWLELIGNS
jgi:hypothetical protein